MNGAMADPCVAINRAPNRAIVIIIGASQYFLRTRRNAQNSAMKLAIDPSELLPHRRSPALRWLALYPIAVSVRIEGELQRPLAGEPHDKRHRRDCEKEEYHQHDRVNHPGHGGTEFQPK